MRKIASWSFAVAAGVMIASASASAQDAIGAQPVGFAGNTIEPMGPNRSAQPRHTTPALEAEHERGVAVLRPRSVRARDSAAARRTRGGGPVPQPPDGTGSRRSRGGGGQ